MFSQRAVRIGGGVLIPAAFAFYALAQQPAPWKSLFDGKTSAGWKEISGKPFPATWTIEDGCLKALVKPGGAQDIVTEDKFTNFDLDFEWKLLAGGNSGVKYLIQNEDEWNNKDGRQARARGLEYQLADDAHPDVSGDATRMTASLYSVIAPSPRTPTAMSVFHKSRILVQGNHAEHWLDDVRVVSFELTDPKVQDQLRKNLPKGSTAATPLRRVTAISLQNHGSETWFRNLRVRRLE